jgi:hypothetical protein
MSKKTIYLIIISSIALFVILASFVIALNFLSNKSSKFINNNPASENSKDTSINNNPSSAVTTISTSSQASLSAGSFPLDIAKKTGKADPCLAIGNAQDKDLCLVLLAESMGNKDICGYITDNNDSQQQCVDRALVSLAISNKKISYCLEVKDSGRNHLCVLNVLDKISDLKNDDCVALPDAERGYCNDYLQRKNDWIIYNSAKTADGCASIVTPGIKEYCLYKISK